MAGLTQAEAERRLEERGALEPGASRSTRSIVLANVVTPFNAVLVALGVLTLLFSDWRDALFLGIVIANAGIGIAQELRAKRALDRLSALVAPRATVVREGQVRELEVEQVVEGDLVRVAPGDQVVADGTLEQADGLALDESILTGESRPVARGHGEEVRSGSFVVEGTGAYAVEAVGTAACCHGCRSGRTCAGSPRWWPSALRGGVNSSRAWAACGLAPRPPATNTRKPGSTVPSSRGRATAMTPTSLNMACPQSVAHPEKLILNFRGRRWASGVGVKVEGVGTTTLTVHGVTHIDRDVDYAPSEDPVEAMSLLAAAVVTESELTIRRVPVEFLEIELAILEEMGLDHERSAEYAADNGRTRLIDLTVRPSKLQAPIDKIHPMPFPGVNIDNVPFFAAIAAAAQGSTLIHDWVYDNRAIYLTELNRLGAHVKLLDPHRVLVEGPTRWRSAEMMCPPALRPAVVVLLAMMAAPGTSVLRNVYVINRGYEDLAERLNSIGAQIETFRDI